MCESRRPPPLVPSSPMWHFLAKIDIKRSHSCTAFPIEFLSPKKVHNLHAIKIMDISKKNEVNPNPVTAVQRFGIFQK